MDSDNNRLVSGALPKEEWCVYVCVRVFVNILHVCVCMCACDEGCVCVKGGLLTTFMAMKSIFRDC